MGGCCSCPGMPSAVDSCLSAICEWCLFAWFRSLEGTGQLRLGGVVLSCIAACLLAIAISTEFWVRRFSRGIFIFRGLWIDCRLGKCTRPEQRPSYIIVSIFFMLLSIVGCYGSVIFGTLSFMAAPSPKRVTWPTLTIGSCFFSGFTGGMGLFNFMRSATLHPNTFLSWSLVPGWFSVIMSAMAGVCQFVAKRWEEDEIASMLWASKTALILEEEWATPTDSENSLDQAM